MTDDARRDLFVGGMDAGIEALLLDAGGRWLDAPAPASDPLGPWVGLAFSAARRPGVDLTLRVCRDHGWPVWDGEVGSSATTAWVQEAVAVRLLGRLARDDAAPDAVVVDAAELSPAQIQGIREALPVGTYLSTIDRSGLTNRP